MQVKTTLRLLLTQSEWQSPKRRIAHVGAAVNKKEPTHTAAKDIKSCATRESNMEATQKLNVDLPYGPPILLPDIYPKNFKLTY